MNSEIESLLGPMTEKLQSTLSQWTHDKGEKYGERLKVLSRALGKASEELREGNEQALARLFEQGASGLEQIADQAGEKDAQTLLKELRDQSRNNPAGVFAASLFAGFIGSRVVREASHVHSESTSTELGQQKSQELSGQGQSEEQTPTFQEIANKTRGSNNYSNSNLQH